MIWCMLICTFLESVAKLLVLKKALFVHNSNNEWVMNNLVIFSRIKICCKTNVCTGNRHYCVLFDVYLKQRNVVICLYFLWKIEHVKNIFFHWQKVTKIKRPISFLLFLAKLSFSRIRANIKECTFIVNAIFLKVRH